MVFGWGCLDCADLVPRRTRLLEGEEGEKLRKKVWGEIVEALKKDGMSESVGSWP